MTDRASWAGLLALGATGTVCVIGICVLVVANTDDPQTIAAVTALSNIGAAAVGALAAWVTRGRSGQATELPAGAPVASPGALDDPNAAGPAVPGGLDDGRNPSGVT